MKSSNIGILQYESDNSYKLEKELDSLKIESQLKKLFTSVRKITFEDGAIPFCKIYEPPSFFVNRFIYQLTDSGNRYQMIACINTNMLDILVMKCIEEVRPISRKYTLLKIDCDYLNIPFEDGLEVFDSTKANWLKL